MCITCSLICPHFSLKKKGGDKYICGNFPSAEKWLGNRSEEERKISSKLQCKEDISIVQGRMNWIEKEESKERREGAFEVVHV